MAKFTPSLRGLKLPLRSILVHRDICLNSNCESDDDCYDIVEYTSLYSFASLSYFFTYYFRFVKVTSGTCLCSRVDILIWYLLIVVDINESDSTIELLWMWKEFCHPIRSFVLNVFPVIVGHHLTSFTDIVDCYWGLWPPTISDFFTSAILVADWLSLLDQDYFVCSLWLTDHGALLRLSLFCLSIRLDIVLVWCSVWCVSWTISGLLATSHLNGTWPQLYRLPNLVKMHLTQQVTVL